MVYRLSDEDKEMFRKLLSLPVEDYECCVRVERPEPATELMFGRKYALEESIVEVTFTTKMTKREFDKIVGGK